MEMQGDRGVRAAMLVGTISFVISACGGGGGNTRTDPPPASAPAPAPTPAPAPAPSPSIAQPGVDSHLQNSGAAAAHAAGLTGAGYAIGIVDSGVNRNHPTLQGRVLLNNVYISGATNNLLTDDVVGHGTTVAQLAAGNVAGAWPGGIAPGATVLSARIIADKSPTDDGSGKGNEVTGALGLMGVHNDLIRAGMRIMNNSWGGLYWSAPTATAPIASEYRPFIASHDGLVVFAAGNESRPNPTDMAALPSQPGPNGTRPAADLERGWLTVVAVNADDPSQLSYYSNACGLAANYCLAAQGTSAFIDAKATAGNGSYTMYYGSGTSYAAPLVSGAAALVWQAFPYFSNDDVRRTLLGTARDLGEPGVDAIFGHGLLDIATSINGPKRLDLGNFDITLATQDSTWANALSGSGGIIKRGAGTLTLSSSGNGNTGDTQIREGSLDAMSLGSGQVQIGSGARLLSRGSVAGSIDNAGTFELDAGDSAQVQVGGDYVQHDGAVLALQVGDVLKVGGSATLHGGDLKVLGKRDYVSLGEQRQVIEAAEGVVGRFSSLTAPSSLFVEGVLDYAANGVRLTLNRLDVRAASADLSGIRAASLTSADRLEQAFAQIDTRLKNSAGSPSAQLLQAAGQFQSINQNAQALANLESLAGTSHVEALAAHADVLDGARSLVASRAVAQRDPASWFEQTAQGMTDGWQSHGWLQGMGLSLGRGMQGGLAFGEHQLAATHALGGRDQDRQTQAHLWFGLQTDHGYAVATASTAHGDRRSDRRLMLGQWQGVAQTRYGLRMDSVGAELGLRLGSVRQGWQPHVGLSMQQLRSDGFSERDVLGFGLQSEALAMRRHVGMVGVRSHWEAAGWQWEGQLYWQQLLAEKGLDWQARYTGFEAWAGLDNEPLQRSHGRAKVSARQSMEQGELLLQLEQRLADRHPESRAAVYWRGRF